MPRIPDFVLALVAYLYEDEEFAASADENGGTGFLVSTPCVDPLLAKMRFSHLHIVTNKHVIDDYPVYKLAGPDQTYIIKRPKKWHLHKGGDDLAVAYFDCESDQFKGWHAGHRADLIATEAIIKEMHIGIGDDIYWLGRFVALDDEQGGWPVVRFGHIASMPRLILQYERKHVQNSFVLETWSYAGFSGAPIFVYSEHFGKHGGVYLLGVNWGHSSEIERKDKKAKRNLPPSLQTPDDLNTGMMLAVPAWEILSILNSEELKMQRDEKEKTIIEELSKKYRRGAGVMDSTKRTDLGTFKDFAKKIIQVPKEEIDEQANKKRRKKK